MSQDERPLLSRDDDNVQDDHDQQPTETEPLLATQRRAQNDAEIDDHDGTASEPSSAHTRPRVDKTKRRWPSIIAMAILGLVVILVILIGFLVPPAIQEYAEQASIIEPTDLSIESITPEGVRARIQGNFRLDSTRVANQNTRRIGRLVGGIFRKLQSDNTTVYVSLPHYDDIIIGSADFPPVTLSIVEGHNTAVDVVAEFKPGASTHIRMLVNEWFAGKLDTVKLTGFADVTLKSGIFPVGTHRLVDSMVFEASGLPMPEYSIDRLNFHDISMDEGKEKAVAADVSLTAYNEFPVSGTVPILAFEVLVPACNESEPYIPVADVFTKKIKVNAYSNVTADGEGIIREIPESLTQACPLSKLSPLDHFMESYIHGEDAKVYVRGSKLPSSDTPDWVEEIIKGITVPIDLPGKSFGNFIRNFSLTDVDFKLPSPFADPRDPDSQARVSGNVEVLAAIPEELNLKLGIKSIRSFADLYYEKKKLGELNLDEWQKAKSEKIPGLDGEQDLLNVTAHIVDAPVNITDSDLFGDLLQRMFFGEDDLFLDVNSTVDARVSTVLGTIVVKNVPAEGKIPVKRILRESFTNFLPQVSDLRITNTTTTGMQLQALLNCTNPTPYTAWVPYVNVHIYANESMIGDAVAQDVNVTIGNNSNILVTATWDPVLFGGDASRDASRKLLSEYLSGKNTTIVVKGHRDSIPGMPLVGEALSRMNLTMPTPRLHLPDEDPETDSRAFIREATFHVFSSTASFVLASPLHYNTIYVDFINATAFYNHTEPVGQIIYDQPFAAAPGLTDTPRMPVNWEAGNVGYDKLRAALGGSLKLDATADVTVRMGNWAETVHYEGKGIGAKVRI
ncbi:hypothetical protein NLU13_6391 [Sarocladium strictum]|uniref:Pre-rRNA processing protein n=1 Tax=Sarocladium strictum TaxID=5046 RepID=A0AA39GG55_SARSR|nr:hypothetical protein NLU13_6391 [Sarocladium strictum]